MNEEKTQIADKVALYLNAELDNRLYFVESVSLRHKKTGNIKICRVFSWRDGDGRLHHDYFSQNQQATKITRALASGGYDMPITEKGRIIKPSELKKAMFSCAVGLVV